MMSSTTAISDSKKRSSTTASIEETSSSSCATTSAKRLKPATAASSNNINAGGQNVRVVARVRPLSTKETNEQSQHAIQVVETLQEVATSIHVHNPNSARSSSNKTFDYDACFGPNTTQHHLYQHTLGDLVQTNIFKGFNVTVMAYGQTGSGKTFTMGTEGGAAVAAAAAKTVEEDSNHSSLLVPPAESDGIIPRAVYDLFETKRSLPQGQDRVSVELSYLEIYNEEARDLLAPEGSATTNLHIRDRPDGVMVQGLSTRVVHSPQDVSTLMNQAALKRATASTAMNAVSSRSHAICTLYVTIKPLANTETATTSDGDASVEEEATAEMRAKLTLVDLAGSERIKRTGAEGKRLKEGININKGLFVLGQVVSALSELGQQGNTTSTSNAHIPYRDSKLTRLLQDSLGGNSRTVMVACISPADSNTEESINTLRYAQRTRNIQNTARRNVVSTTNSMSAAEATALKRENQVLKLQLAQAEAKLAAAAAGNGASASIVVANAPGSLKVDTSNTSPDDKTSSTPINTVHGFDVSKLDMIRRLQSTISSLESKMEALEEQQQSTADDVLEASMRADKWQYRYEELSKAAKEQGVALPENTTTSNFNSGGDLVSQMRKEISDLKADLREAISDAAVARATAAAIVAGNGDLDAVAQYASSNSTNDESMDASTDNTNDEQADKEEKLALTAELVALSGGIEAKEAMVLQMNKERECIESMRSHFENAVKSLQEEVDVLSSERESLLSKVAGDDTAKDDDNSDGKKQMKKRIDELESRIKELRHKSAEHTKSLRLREAAEKKCAQLTAEIQSAKKRRVDLQKQLKEQASERRSEKATARKEAMKLMRDSNRLKVELEKVKNAAAKQATVLRRKATEALNKQKRQAELQAKKQQQQEQRKQMAAKKANMKDKSSSAESRPSTDKYSFSNSNNISEERKTELLEWLEEEIDTASALKETQDQIKEQKRLMNDAIAKKAGLSNNNSLMRSSGNLAVNPPTKSMTALEEEIEMRASLIEDLENNISDIIKSSMTSPRARSPSPRSYGSSLSHFLDLNLYQGLTKPEATAVFLQCFDRLLQLKKEMAALQEVRDNDTSRAVQNALIKERRMHEEMIMQLKMDHSQAMMDLLNSTKGSIEQSVRLNSLNSVVDSEFQSTVEEMLGSYLQGCSKVGESLQGDLLEVRQAQEGMKKMVESVTSGLLSDTKSTPQKISKKKKPKKRDSSDSILEEIKLLEMDEADDDADNSDDSDWSPSNKTPGPKRRSRRSADSVTNDSKRRSNDNGSKYSAAVELASVMAPVDEEEQLLKKQPGTVTFASVNESSLDVSGISNPAEDDSFEHQEDSEPSESVTDYASLKVRELKDLLRARSLLVSGIKTELIERLEEDDRTRLGLVDLTGEESSPEAPNAPSDDDWFASKENAISENNESRRTSTRAPLGRGLQNRDLNKPLDQPDTNGKASAKGILPATPPKSVKKVGGWSTKKIASVRRSTIFSSKKRSILPSSSPDSSVDSRHENDENAEPTSKRNRKSSLKTLRTRRNLGVQLGKNGI